MANLTGDSSDPSIAAIVGMHTSGGDGVVGTSDTGNGVRAVSTSGTALSVASDAGFGLVASSQNSNAITAIAYKGQGVYTTSQDGTGLEAHSDTSYGIRTSSRDSDALEARTAGSGTAISAISEQGTAVYANAVNGTYAVYANCAPYCGIFAKGGIYAGWFDGNVMVTGDILLQNADCAEEFDIVEAATEVEPGTVMVLNNEGKLQPSKNAYDKCVAGVISGAGNYKPGIVLDRKHEAAGRLPIALVGKVYCKVDAEHGAIEVGDLLTTSPTPGHAMKAGDILKAFGTVLGKALCSLKVGKGLIPVLVALQ